MVSVDLERPLSVVTPTLDGDVLARLALVDESFTPGQLQRLLPMASVDGIRRVLNRLAGQGVVDATPAGAVATMYRLNREHVAADAIIQLANLWSSVLAKIEFHLSSWQEPPSYAAVFGSWARREARSTSDLDLFLVRPDAVPDRLWEAQVGDVEHHVTRWTGNDARTLVLLESVVREHPGDPVLASIVRDGVTVAGEATWLRSVVRGTAR